MNWLYYLAEGNLYLGVFYLAYCLFLRNETYYQLNRAYLIGSCIVAFILPVLQIGALKPSPVVAAAPMVSYQPAEYYTQQLPVTTQVLQVTAAPMLSTDDYIWFGYLIGALVLLVVLLVKLYSLYKLINKAKHTEQAGYKLVQLPQADIAFSFFNYLFIGDNAHGAKTIIRHELVHIRQKHSVDIVFLELLKIINWFNPFIYLLQNSLKTVHEYIADEQTAAHETDPISYSTFLLNNAYGTGGSTVTHSFFNYNLLKRRIIMLNQKRSGNLARLRYLVALPVVAASLCASTLAFSKNYGWIDLAPAQPTENNIAADTKAAFTPLITHLAKTIPYHPSKGDKHGLVEISFILGDDHKITDAKATNQADSKLITLAETGFAAFDKPIDAAPGKYSFDVYFDDKDYNFTKHKTKKATDLAGEVSLWEKQYINKNGGIVGNATVNNAYAELGDRTKLRLPVIIVNGKRHQFSGTELAQLKAGADFLISGGPTMYKPDNAYALKTWGEDAKNGVIVLDGENARTVVKPAEVNEIRSGMIQEPKKLPPPSVFKKGYGRLMGHLHQKITWTEELKKEKNSYVGVSFEVGADKRISNIKIDKPAGNGFDAVAKAAFESFDGVVTAPAGKHSFMLNYFSNKGPVDKSVLTSTNYDVKLVIVAPKPGEVKVKFPPPVVDKAKRSATHVSDQNGAYVSKGRLNNSQIALATMIGADPKFMIIVNGKQYRFDKERVAKYKPKALISISCDKTTVYNNGNKYAQTKWGDDVGKVIVLEGNASLKFVDYDTAKQSDTEDLILASTKTSRTPASPIDPPPIDQSKLITREFVNYLQENIKFPKYPLDDNFVVTLKVNFSVVNNKIANVELTRAVEDRLIGAPSPTGIVLSNEALNSFKAEVIKVMQSAPIENIGSGKYSVPIAFLYKKGKGLYEVHDILLTKTAKGTLAGVYAPVIKPV